MSDNILEVGASSSHWLEMNESVDGSIPFTLNPEIQNGDVIKFYLSLSNGDYIQGDTISKIFIDNPPVFSDTEASLDHWEIISGPWNQTDNMFYSPRRASPIHLPEFMQIIYPTISIFKTRFPSIRDLKKPT